MKWTEDKQKIGEFICLLMGQCWHEWSTPDAYAISKCKLCNEESYDPRKQFNAFSPSGIFAWKEFMERKIPEVWEKYLHYTMWESDLIKSSTEILNMILDPANFAEWMENNLVLWAYQDCNVCDGKGTIKRLSDSQCHTCNGTGKIINHKYKPLIDWLEKEKK